MERVVHALAHQAVCRKRQRHIVRLERDLHIVEIEFLKHAHMLHRGRNERLRRNAAVFRQHLVIERSGVDADADGDAPLARRRDDLLDALRPADIAGVDAQCRNALRHRLERELVVKVDVRNERRLDLPYDIAEVLRRRHVGHGDAHNVAARRREFAYLLYRRLRVRRLRIAHGLHGDRRPASDGNISNVDLPRRAAFIHRHREGQPPAKIRTTSFFIASSMSRTISPTPAFWT